MRAAPIVVASMLAVVLWGTPSVPPGGSSVGAEPGREESESGGTASDERSPEEDSTADVAGSPGRWGAVRGSRGPGRPNAPELEALTEGQRREFERLSSLAYASGSQPAPRQSGVTVHDPMRAHAGLNFYTSGHFPGAFLMDMDGNLLHEWRLEFTEAWPDRPDQAKQEGAAYWRRAHLFENGDVLAIFEGAGLIKIDKDSRLIWQHFGAEHHDLDVLEDGRIFVLTREPRIVPRLNPRFPVLEDFITVLDENGAELERKSVLGAIEKSQWAGRLMDGRRRGDIMHTNTIEILDGRIADKDVAFKSGNALVCVRQLDAVAVVDMDSVEVVWAQFSPWKEQHQATVLDNGNILLFDNKGNGGASRVIEFDPATRETAWSYATDEPLDFYSKTCGSNQRLPNGNTLITESDYGRAFEVTAEGEIVWEYVNPAQVGDKLRLIATLFEVIRLPEDFPLDWLEGR